MEDTAAPEEEAEAQEVSRKVSVEAQTTGDAGTQEVSRKVSVEVRQFPTQEIPQDLIY